MQRPVQRATWNSDRDLWETDQTVLLSEHSAAYSETLPPSGMTRNGVLYERPTSAHPTSGPGSSSSPDDALLRTPCAAEAEGGPLHPDTARERGQTLRLTGQILAMTGHLLPTPTTNLGTNGGSQDPERRRAGGHSVSLQDIVEHRLLPTPTASDGNGARNATANRSPGSTAHSGVTLNDIVYAGLFGPYAPAIRRWEQTTGHPAPAPTEPTGRGGAHRLSARFAEWMMGLPPGWVTDILISRTEQLRAIGNGVVPQQAVAALQDMLGAFETETGAVAASLN